MITTIYHHPDGHEVVVNNGLLTVCTSEGVAVSIPIGHAGLAAVSKALRAIASDDDTAEEGTTAALDCIDLLLVTDSQGERIRIIQHAITGLQASADFDSAVGGFAVVMEGVIERGLEGLE